MGKSVRASRRWAAEATDHRGSCFEMTGGRRFLALAREGDDWLCHEWFKTKAGEERAKEIRIPHKLLVECLVAGTIRKVGSLLGEQEST